MQCTAHTWLSPRHVLVAADKGKVICQYDEDINGNGDKGKENGKWERENADKGKVICQYNEDINRNGDDDDDFTAN